MEKKDERQQEEERGRTEQEEKQPERDKRRAEQDESQIKQAEEQARQSGAKNGVAVDETYMRLAIREARKAAAIGEVPIGCVIVFGDRVIARGYNRRMTDKSTLAHAEITAIKKACKKVGDWRLEGCTLYVTLEPCPMCAGAIVQARIPRTVIGCMNPKAGCAGSVLNLLNEKGFNHQVEVTSGVMGEDCSRMMKDFFKELRKKEKHGV